MRTPTLSRGRAFAAILAALVAAVGPGGVRLRAESGERVDPTSPPPPEAARDAGGAAAALTFEGRVVELDTERPIEGATVTVERSLRGSGEGPPPPWVGRSTLRTDAEGRFAVSVPPDQVAEPRLSIALNVTHPDFVPRKGIARPLTGLIRGREAGDRPFFASVTLERGLLYSGRVVRPDGRPAADVPYWFEYWSWSNQSSYFYNDTEGRTDAEGRFRLRMPKTHALAISLTPDDDALFRRFWGTAESSKHPYVWAPTDLGRIELRPGLRLSGRLVDLQGRPIGGQRLVVRGRINIRFHRETTTAPDGSFTFAPLVAGSYTLFGEGQGHGQYIDPTARPMPATAPVIRPLKVVLREGQEPPPVVLREVESVLVEARFVDSQDRPTRGDFVSLAGLIPDDAGKTNPFESSAGMRPASAINDPEPEDRSTRLDWGVQLMPDATGLVVFRAPRGLRNVAVQTFSPDETISIKTRLGEGKPLKYWGGGRIGDLDGDLKGITFVCYHAPTVVATVTTDRGELPDDLDVSSRFVVNGGSYGGGFIRQDDGRYRSVSLMPDHDYEISAAARGYFPAKVEHVNLPEGATAEVALVLKKKPSAEVGDAAPAFSVKATDGRPLTLEALTGKVVLLVFWASWSGPCLDDVPRLKELHQRFGQDERFAMIGLGLDNDPEAAARVVKEKGMPWPQAVLPGRGRDPVAAAYGVGAVPATFLVGPDGKVLARDLRGDRIVEAVADALQRK